MRILFWGTPDFAVAPLRALLGEGHDVVGVVTQPDRPRGRSRSQLDPSPVKVVALSEGIPVLQPERPRGPEFEEAVRALAPDVSVVVAYGCLLPKSVIDLPRLGTLNIHGSILPAWRGAAPIQASILHGDPETGISIMQMVPALDAGPVLHVLRTTILDDETYGELHDRLLELGALAIVQALALIDAGASRPLPQDDAFATYAPKIDRAMTRVNWQQPAAVVARAIRAFDPRPGAIAALPSGEVKLFGARVVGAGTDDALDATTHAAPAGTLCAVDDDGLVVRCGAGAVRVREVQPSGRTRCRAVDWVRGRGVLVGAQFA